jgi:carbon-monoxide dehydrogenase medium subunit
MYPAKFDYYRAVSVTEALSLMQRHEGARFLAGGHSLIPVMKLRLADASALIDIGRIAELRGISTRNGTLHIGALTPHVELARSGLVPTGMSEAAGGIGDPQVRNRGTIGGNIAHADPASDWPIVLTALDATIHIRGTGGERTVRAGEFFVGLFETSLQQDELITGISVTSHDDGTGSAYAKMFHPASGYAIVGAATVVTASAGLCNSASIAVGGLTASAKKAPSVAAALAGKSLNADNIATAADSVLKDLGDDIIGDFHASTDYRKAMIKVYVKRALSAAAERL